MNVYLHEIDIDEKGAEISLPCSIYEYITKFIFFADSVYLQSSSALKRKDMIYFYCSHSDFFTAINDNRTPYISFVLDPRFSSLSEYIDSRLSILSSNSDQQNIELSVYMENNAEQKAKEIDDGIKSGDFARRTENINIIYRNNLQNLNISKGGDDIRKGIEIIDDYVINNNFIQTFDLMNRIDNVVTNQESLDLLGKAIRNSYFEANAAAVGCAYHSRDWHLHYSNIDQFSSAIGLNRLFKFNWKIDSIIVTKIKSLPSFQNLLNLYYAMDDHARFCAFMTYLLTGKDSSLYHFHEITYFRKNKNKLQKELNILKNIVYHEER